MEDAVESLVFEEESKKLMKPKSIFHRFRNKNSSDNNNCSTDNKNSVLAGDKMSPNEESSDSTIDSASHNEDKHSVASCSHAFENCKDSVVNNSSSDQEKKSPIPSMNPGKDNVSKLKCNGVKETILCGIKERIVPLPQKNSSCLLLRLFESKLFDMSIAMSYLFKSKESGVQAYLGNKLFVSIVSRMRDQCGL